MVIVTLCADERMEAGRITSWRWRKSLMVLLSGVVLISPVARVLNDETRRRSVEASSLSIAQPLTVKRDETKK